jgi:hypothetical protein
MKRFHSRVEAQWAGFVVIMTHCSLEPLALPPELQRLEFRFEWLQEQIMVSMRRVEVTCGTRVCPERRPSPMVYPGLREP